MIELMLFMTAIILAATVFNMLLLQELVSKDKLIRLNEVHYV